MKTLVNFILAHEAGLKIDDKNQDPEKTFAMARRSGWSDHPADSGGATMCGVTMDTYRRFCRSRNFPTPTKADLREMPFSHWLQIFRNNFWNLCRASEIRSPEVAYIIVDWVWASGPKVIRYIQSILGVKADGIIGPKSIAAINRFLPITLWSRIYQRRLQFIMDISKPGSKNHIFRRGWIRRLNDLPNPDLS